MDWFRVESAIYDHPKLRTLTPGAFRALLFAWAYVARHDLRGKLPESALQTVQLTPKRVAALERAGLLYRNGDGCLHIHDWDDYQGRGEELSRLRASANRRKARERARRRAAENGGA